MTELVITDHINPPTLRNSQNVLMRIQRIQKIVLCGLVQGVGTVVMGSVTLKRFAFLYIKI